MDRPTFESGSGKGYPQRRGRTSASSISSRFTRSSGARPRQAPNLRQRKRKLIKPREYPIELYQHVVKFVTDARDLFNLCLTSRAFRAEAERELYRTVDLAQDCHTPVLWAETILGDSSKAQRVESLTLRFDLSFLIIPDKLLASLQRIAAALRTLPNLRTLVLEGHPMAMMHPVHLWLLDGCSFQLEVFHNSVFPYPAIEPFLARHPQMREWKQAGLPMTNHTMPDSVLPALTSLDVDAVTLTCLNPTRPLTNLRLLFTRPMGEVQERLILEKLALFNSTLSTAVIEREYTHPDSLHTVDILKILAKGNSGLNCLILKDQKTTFSDNRFYEIPPILSLFSHLQNFVFEVCPLGTRRPLRSDACRRLAERFFRACLPLRFLAIPEPGSNFLVSFYAHQTPQGLQVNPTCSSNLSFLVC